MFPLTWKGFGVNAYKQATLLQKNFLALTILSNVFQGPPGSPGKDGIPGQPGANVCIPSDLSFFNRVTVLP